MELIEIAAALVTIVGGFYGLWRWLGTRIRAKQPSGFFLKDGNIHLTYKTGTTLQITFSNADTTPLLGRKKVVFFREVKNTNRDRVSGHYKLLAVDLQTLQEAVVSDQKPFADGMDGSYKILQPGAMTFSSDQSEVLFTIEKYVTASQLVKVNITTGQWTELFSAEKIELITGGKRKGKLLVGKSEIRDRCRDIYYAVCEHDGKVLRDFRDYDEYMQFRSQAMLKEV